MERLIMRKNWQDVSAIKLGDVKTIVHQGTLAEAICVGFGRDGALFIEQIDGGTEPEDIEIYCPATEKVFDNTVEGRTKAVEVWKS
jgi:hypothetical protein